MLHKLTEKIIHQTILNFDTFLYPMCFCAVRAVTENEPQRGKQSIKESIILKISVVTIASKIC